MSNRARSNRKDGRKRTETAGKPARPRYAAPAVDQALDIIEFLSRNTPAYGINELSRTLNISTNTVFRILRRLTERGYTEQDPSGGYRMGTQFFALGMRLYTRFELRLRARPHLEKLAADTHETCQIHVPDKDRVLVLDCLIPQAEFFLQTTPGSRFHYHPNAFGKAILAFLSETEIKDILPEKLASLAPKTITSRRQLLSHLKQVRETGIAYDMEEYSVGFFCIGSPVFDVTGKVVAGIGITGVLRPPVRRQFPQWEERVLSCAEHISRDIGYSGNAFKEFATNRAKLSPKRSRSK